MSGTVAFVLKGYPRLSETFIAQEIQALERLGLGIRIYSLRHPTDHKRHSVHEQIIAPVTYLPEYLHDEPRRVASAWADARKLQGYSKARKIFLADLAQDRTRNRVRRFGQAMVLAQALLPTTTHIHAHFMHTPASVARYAAAMTNLPWSFSAHAKDIWTSPVWEKKAKLAACNWAVTCTRAGHEHLKSLTTKDNISLVYHGLDLDRFAPARRTDGRRDGSAPADPTRLLSVGRAVEKKGYDDLLEALGALPRDVAWNLVHIGGGPMLEELTSRARQLGIDGRIEWRGPQDQRAVMEAYRKADLFVLASRRAADGDMDGLPNVLIEAQSQGLAVVATRLSGVPELIEHNRNGLLVEPGNPPALAAALRQMITSPDQRQTMGEEGAVRVRSDFSLKTCIEPLAAQFGLKHISAA